MALAEARAAWQRTANRCLVQEDAKRAPRLACYSSSAPPSTKQDETGPTSTSTMQEIPSSNSAPFTRSPPHPNLSPNSRWWLQLQPNYAYHKGLMGEQIEHSFDVAKDGDDSKLADQTSLIESPFGDQCGNSITCGKKDDKDEKLISVYDQNCKDLLKLGYKENVEEVRDENLVSFEVLKMCDDLSFDSESSWVGVKKNTLWWRTADTEELALLVEQRSLDLLENCDLPMPQNNHVKKNLSRMSNSLPARKGGIGNHHHLHTHNSAPASLTGGRSFQEFRLVAEDKLLSGTDKLVRGSQFLKRKPEMNEADEEASKAQLLEALRHSQTRAREADKVAKQARAETQHVVKLVLRQASQLFAYKQWLQLLQFENACFEFKNNKSPPPPEISPWTAPRRGKRRKGWAKPSSRKRAKKACSHHDVGKYAIVFALGLGLVGAGLLLGWTIGWMLPPW